MVVLGVVEKAPGGSLQTFQIYSTQSSGQETAGLCTLKRVIAFCMSASRQNAQELDTRAPRRLIKPSRSECAVGRLGAVREGRMFDALILNQAEKVPYSSVEGTSFPKSQITVSCFVTRNLFNP